MKYDSVMIIHMEPEPDAIQSLKNLLDYNKNLKLVWAHVGSTERAPAKSKIGELMDRHPNLYTDISGIQPISLCPSGGGRRATMTDNRGNLLPVLHVNPASRYETRRLTIPIKGIVYVIGMKSWNVYPEPPTAQGQTTQAPTHSIRASNFINCLVTCWSVYLSLESQAKRIVW